jgi:hypothetical protein
LTLSVSYIIVKKKRIRQRAALDESTEETDGAEHQRFWTRNSETPPGDSV